jgi:hypothetical protein
MRAMTEVRDRAVWAIAKGGRYDVKPAPTRRHAEAARSAEPISAPSGKNGSPDYLKDDKDAAEDP